MSATPDAPLPPGEPDAADAPLLTPGETAAAAPAAAASTSTAEIQQALVIATGVLSEMTKACKFSRLYPGGHTRIDEAHEVIAGSLREGLQVSPVMTIATLTGRLSVNGTPVTGVDSTVQTMVEIIDSLNVESIQFQRGITIEEITALTGLFARRPTEALVNGKIDPELLKDFTHIKINEVRIRIMTEEEELLLQNGLKSFFGGQTAVKTSGDMLEVPMNAIESLVDGLAGCCREAMATYRETGDPKPVQSVAMQSFFAVLPLVMAKDLSQVRQVAKRIFDALGEEGLEVVMGRKMEFDEAVRTLLKEIPLERRMQMLIEEFERRDIDIDNAGKEMMAIFDESELGNLARLASDHVLKVGEGAEGGGKWEFLEKVVGSLASGMGSPAPLALFLLRADEPAEPLIRGLTPAGASCLILKERENLERYAEIFAPSFLYLHGSHFLDDTAAIMAVRQLLPESQLVLQDLERDRFSRREQKALAPCKWQTELMTSGKLADLTLRALKLKTDDAGTQSPDAKRARQIQLALLPKEIPPMPPYETACFYESCLHVGGDYYDVIETKSGARVLVVADVSGKGAAAAMVMVMMRSVLRMLVAQGLENDELVTSLNEYIARDIHSGLFVTACLMIYNPEKDVFRHYRAGHNPLIHVKTDGACDIILEAAGLAIGFPQTQIFNQALKPVELTLREGEFLFAYTDGITEAMNTEDKEYGMDRLLAVLRECRALPSKEIVRKVLESIEVFVSGAPRHDDMTLMVTKREGGQPATGGGAAEAGKEEE